MNKKETSAYKEETFYITYKKSYGVTWLGTSFHSSVSMYVKEALEYYTSARMLDSDWSGACESVDSCSFI